MTLPSETQVLIVGAGPSGLALATCLAGHGVNYVLVDRLETAPDTSRAAAVHARTLEVLEPLGVTEAMVDAGRRISKVALHERDKVLLQIGFGQIPSRYQFILALPQNATEAILMRRLEALGGRVLRGQEAKGLVQDDAGVTVTFQDKARSPGSVRASYVVGADGYHSTMRQSAGIGFFTGTYAQTFILADLHLDWPLGSNEMRLFLAPDGLLLVVPFSDDRFRIVATVASAEPHPTLSDVQAILDRRGPGGSLGRVHDMVWSSRFHVHHGVVDQYRAGQVFVVGDAAHVHSPAGGQGMNIGIQDAVALGDRLGAVINGQEADGYLDGYQAERRPVAQQVVAATDQMTRLGTLTGAVGQRLRNIGLQMVGHLPPLQRTIASRIAELNG